MSIMKTRYLLFVVAFLSASLDPGGIELARQLNAQSVNRLKPAASQGFIAIGKLIRSGKTRNGTPMFALLDDEGSITNYVVPAAGLNLSGFVNQQVGVKARSMSKGRDNLPYILAQKVTPLDAQSSAGEPTAAEVAPSIVAKEPSIVRDTPEPLDDAEAEGFEEIELEDVDEVIPAGADVIEPPPGMPFDIAVSEDPSFMDESPMEDCGPEGCMGGPMCPTCSGDATACLPSDCCPCGPSGRFWVRGEYVFWWTKGMDLPALVTTSPSNTPAQNAGVLGQAGTQVVFGNQEVLDDVHNGARFRLGKWCEFCQWIGLEVDFFFISEESENFTQTSNGAPILARPFFNTAENAQDSELIAFPGVVSGRIDVDTASELFSVAPRFRVNLNCMNFSPHPAQACSYGNGCGGVSCDLPGSQRLDLILGYRFVSLDESLAVREILTSNRNGVITNFDLVDAFDTENEFHGGEIGLLFERYRGPWSIELLGKVALGNNHEVVEIRGSTTSVSGGISFADPGGLLALSSNIGRHSDDAFVAIPEFNATLGYLIAPSLRFLAGYTFFYWSDVVRPGEQIDLTVNPDLIPPPLTTTGPQRPAFALNESDFWAQGLSLGLEYRW